MNIAGRKAGFLFFRGMNTVTVREFSGASGRLLYVRAHSTDTAQTTHLPGVWRLKALPEASGRDERAARESRFPKAPVREWPGGITQPDPDMRQPYRLSIRQDVLPVHAREHSSLQTQQDAARGSRSVTAPLSLTGPLPDSFHKRLTGRALAVLSDRQDGRTASGISNPERRPGPGRTLQ